MKIKNMSKGMMVIAIMLFSSCALDVTTKDTYSNGGGGGGTVPTPPTLDVVYSQLNGLITQSDWFAMEEHTTDELMGPTRGTDWDDFGTWRKLHLHTWDGSHNQVLSAWNTINGGLFNTTLVAETATGQPQAEAKFLRAYFAYLSCDLYGQVQHRPATAEVQVLPDVYTRSEAIDYIITELEAALPNLPSFNGTNRAQATKEAAQLLLAKCYLNKAVFKQDPTKPAGPYTFDAGDMNKVISYVDALSSNGALSISTNYWDNFTWKNSTASTENIFVRPNYNGVSHDPRFTAYMGAHYNMTPSGWNGFVTLSDFYNSFENADARRNYWVPNYSDSVGYNAGFLIGQIQGPAGNKIKDNNTLVDLKDRSGNPLILTADASLYFSTETKGIRTNKYPLLPATMSSRQGKITIDGFTVDQNTGGNSSPNDFVFFRLADAKLMKAEAILRGGSPTNGETPASIVNAIRAKRGATVLGTVDLTAMLAERGRELYLEAWRRNDLVRFGKFNDPVIERATASDGSRVVFPIPNIALSSNPNLKQNFGY